MKDTITSKMRLETIYEKSLEEKVGDKIKIFGKAVIFSVGFVLPVILVIYAFILITN